MPFIGSKKTLLNVVFRSVFFVLRVSFLRFAWQATFAYLLVRIGAKSVEIYRCDLRM